MVIEVGAEKTRGVDRTLFRDIIIFGWLVDQKIKM